MWLSVHSGGWEATGAPALPGAGSPAGTDGTNSALKPYRASELQAAGKAGWQSSREVAGRSQCAKRSHDVAHGTQLSEQARWWAACRSNYALAAGSKLRSCGGMKPCGIHAVSNIWIQLGDFRGVRMPSASPAWRSR